MLVTLRVKGLKKISQIQLHNQLTNLQFLQ